MAVKSLYEKTVWVQDTTKSKNPLIFYSCPLWWQKQGLSYTASGYGNKVPTRYCTRVPEWGTRLYRVYCMIWSNVGSLYIIHHGRNYFINEYRVRL